MHVTMPVVGLIGVGYVLSALGVMLKGCGVSVRGVVATSQSVERLQACGYAVSSDDETHPESFLDGITHLVFSIPPAQQNRWLTRWSPALQAIQALQRDRKLRWIGYLSSTSVYGDAQGAWIDEETPANPATDMGIARVQAEKMWEAVARDHHVAVDIFRLSGIYGPGRNALQRVLAALPNRVIVPEREGFVSNRIHRDDIARVLMATILDPHPPALGVQHWNLADGDPASPYDVVTFATYLLGVPKPERRDWRDSDVHSTQRPFYAASKRLVNGTLRRRLPGLGLGASDYRSALTDLWLRGPAVYLDPNALPILPPYRF